MNIHPENIIVNSCEYTPVYLIPNPGVTQVGSYYLTSSARDVQVQKPVSDNLKRFYENSGNLDSGVLTSGSPKPRILKKQTTNVVGNNLKLASFLLPKSEPQPQVSVSMPNNVPQKTANIPQKTAKLTPVTNVLLKPTINTNNNKIDTCTREVHTPQPPLMEVDRKIVRVGTIPSKKKGFPPQNPKAPLKLLPKEPLPTAPVTTANTTSVQLIKLGQTYHSLNQLSEDQIQIVNKALKMFSSAQAPRPPQAPEQPKEPVFNPDDKPKFIYKLVPAKDLSPSDRRLLVKKRGDIRKHPIKKVERKEVKQEPNNDDDGATEQFIAEEVPPPKVTRSGRTVKLSRHIRRAESPQKPKKKITPNTVQCCQCRNEFTSLYRLQRHYDNFPTHYPERVHSNLFHCLQAILKGCHNNQAFMFVQQLEQLIDKLRSLLPCLLKKMDGVEASPCTVTDQIGRLFGMLPGKYNLNMDALNCVKDTEGHCIHNPPLIKSEQTQMRVTDDSQTITLAPIQDMEDCARINSVDKWPTISKRILNKKKIAAENLKAKRIRLASENGEAIELTIDDVSYEYEPQKEQVSTLIAEINKESLIKESLEDAAKSPKSAQFNDSEPIIIHDLTKSTSNEQIVTAPVKFYSTHFDIRSSPIKLPSALVKKFQLKPEEVSSEVQILRPCNEQSNLENGLQVQILRPCNEQNNQDLENHEIVNISNGVAQNENSLSHDDSFIDQMFPDNELPKEVLYELNQLSFPSNIFDSPLTKALKEVTHFDQSLEKQILFDPSLIDSSSNQSSSKMIEPTLLLKDKVDGYFEPSAIRVKTEKPNGISKSALTHVKERSKILFEVLTDNDNHNATEQMNDQHLQKPHNVFSQVNKSISSLFDTSAISPTNGLMRSHTNNGIFESGIKHSKDDTLISSSFIDDKSNDMMVSTTMNEPSVIEKPSSIIDSNLMDEKSLSDLNDVRLLNNQGQSVLNFLEALGPDCLSYPETDIRNNAEDFQLDLFSFSCS